MVKKDVESMKLVQVTEKSIQSSDLIYFLTDFVASEIKREIVGTDQSWENKDHFAMQYMKFLVKFYLIY